MKQMSFKAKCWKLLYPDTQCKLEPESNTHCAHMKAFEGKLRKNHKGGTQRLWRLMLHVTDEVMPNILSSAL